MKRQKYVLLEADERLLQLHKGEVKFYYPEELLHQLKSIKSKRRRFRSHRIPLIILALIPILLYLTLTLLICGIVYLFKGKEYAEKVFDRAEKILKFLAPFSENTILDETEEEKKIKYRKREKEDVPAFLNRAKRYEYIRSVWIPMDQSSVLPKWEKLQKQGYIDEIHLYADYSEKISFYLSDQVIQEYSWIINLWKDPNFASELGVGANIIWLYNDISFSPPDNNIVSSYDQASSLIAFSRIKLPYNKFLDEKVVFYFERTHHALTNQVISERYFELNKKLGEKGLHLLYLPVFHELNDPKNLDIALHAFYNIHRPDLYFNQQKLTPEHLFKWSRQIDFEGLSNFIGTYLEIPEGPDPCLIHCVQVTAGLPQNIKLSYSLFPLNTSSILEINKDLDEYLTIARLPVQEVYYQLSAGNRFESEEEGYNADFQFDTDGDLLSEEVKAKVLEIKEGAQNGQMLETLLYIVGQFREINPALCASICNQLANASHSIERVISRIHIDSGHRIYLVDYNRMEIEMSALPKTIFIFLLRHPEGVVFKELYKHRKELIRIYSKVSNRSDLAQMEKSILDITDAKSNSINEKCSRIKEAFLSNLHEDLAKNYFVTGYRSSPKKIILDRKLVQIDSEY